MTCTVYVLTRHSASSVHDYTAQSYSTVQFCAGNMSHKYTMWKHMVHLDRPQMTCVMGRMRFACCVTKAIDTHSEYVILIPLPRQRWFREGVSMLRLYIHCLSSILTCYQGGIPQIVKRLSKGRAKKRTFPFVDPIIFRYKAGNHGSQLTTSFLNIAFRRRSDVSLFLITYTNNITIAILIKEVSQEPEKIHGQNLVANCTLIQTLLTLLYRKTLVKNTSKSQCKQR